MELFLNVRARIWILLKRGLQLFWEQSVQEGVKTHATKSTVTLVKKVVAKSIKALNHKGTKTTKEKKTLLCGSLLCRA